MKSIIMHITVGMMCSAVAMWNTCVLTDHTWANYRHLLYICPSIKTRTPSSLQEVHFTCFTSHSMPSERPLPFLAVHNNHKNTISMASLRLASESKTVLARTCRLQYAKNPWRCVMRQSILIRNQYGLVFVAPQCMSVYKEEQALSPETSRCESILWDPMPVHGISEIPWYRRRMQRSNPKRITVFVWSTSLAIDSVNMTPRQKGKGHTPIQYTQDRRPCQLG